MPDFHNNVYQQIKKIPKGRLSTYKEIARSLCRPGAARAVGNALNKNPFAPLVPCHRIVKSDGSLGGYNGGISKKISLLKSEGIKIKAGKILNFSEIFFKL